MICLILYLTENYLQGYGLSTEEYVYINTVLHNQMNITQDLHQKQTLQ